MREFWLVFGKVRSGRAALLWFLLAGNVLFVACKTTTFGTSAKIVALNLITVPVALDLDGLPGADGISVKVYAMAEKNPKPVPIRDGTLEVVMFDGPFVRQSAAPPVLKEFRFSPSDLRAAEFSAKIGTGYQFSLPWGTNLPAHRIMSVAARYTTADGQALTSRPSSVTVLAK